MSGPFRIPVLTYHDLAGRIGAVDPSHRPYVMRAETFRDQLRVLQDAGFVGTRLDALLATGDPPPGGPRRCVLTFDDGHESNCTLALPLILEAGFSATFFVTAGWIGKPASMSWEQVREMSAAGMEIGSHSMTHRPPATLSPAELRAEMGDSRKLLEDRLGTRVLSASSPTGFFNPRMVPVVRDLGYAALCTGRLGLWKDPGNRFLIPRLPVKYSTGPAEFLGLACGNGWLVARLRSRQIARNALKSALGVDSYRRFRRWWLR